MRANTSPFFELARVLVRFNHVMSAATEAHLGDGKRFIVCTDEKLAVVLELKSAIAAVLY
jgi:hypothetical protein